MRSCGECGAPRLEEPSCRECGTEHDHPRVQARRSSAKPSRPAAAGRRQDATVVLSLAVGVLVAALVVGTLLLLADSEKSAEATGGPTAGPTEPSPGRSLPAARTPKPAPKPVSRCWDRSRVTPPETCAVESEEAQFHAFGIDRDSCRQAPGLGGTHNRWSYVCPVRGVLVHLATYRLEDRSERLSSYGVRQDLGNGRILAGGPASAVKRWVRTYRDTAAGKGLLMYVSVEASEPRARKVLLGLQQRFAGELLHGDPITVSR